MNSYTSTSKRIKFSILLFFFSFIVTIVFVDLLLGYYASTKTTSKSFITEKQSKIKHCALNNPIDKDIIFIGSSRTFYHISTNEFKKNGMDIYNRGVSNNAVEDYAAFVHKAITYKPKAIVISLEVNELFKPLPLASYPTYDDLKSYFATMDSKYLASASLRWIQNFHSLLRYSESIYLKIKSFYNKYEISAVDKNTFYRNTKRINYDDISDCHLFSKKFVSDDFITTKCENGDGILFGNNLPSGDQKNVNLTALNHKTLDFVNYLIKEINQNGIKPIVILEPVCQYYTKYNYDFKDIQTSIDAIMMDLTELNTSKEMWADARHFNNEGRLFYSKRLEKY